MEELEDTLPVRVRKMKRPTDVSIRAFYERSGWIKQQTDQTKMSDVKVGLEMVLMMTMLKIGNCINVTNQTGNVRREIWLSRPIDLPGFVSPYLGQR